MATQSASLGNYVSTSQVAAQPPTVLQPSIPSTNPQHYQSPQPAAPIQMPAHHQEVQKHVPPTANGSSTLATEANLPSAEIAMQPSVDSVPSSPRKPTPTPREASKTPRGSSISSRRQSKEIETGRVHFGFSKLSKKITMRQHMIFQFYVVDSCAARRLP
jgi:hypothetical protein